ncbi:MAG: transporter substrate-binding protein [Tardiphaga sp.]|nr:transporter substrate-binding protein [Tardiphaga sp.]
MHRALGLLTLLVTLAGGIASASAHPHVWVTASSELVYAPDGSVTGVRHSWTFDDMFSTYALQGVETKTKGVYTREELAPLAQTNVESLKEFGFFTFAKADGKKQRFLDPVDYYLERKDAALVLHFTLPFKTPFKTRQLALEVFDPTFFVDFGLEKKDPVRLIGAPASCTMAIQRPNDGAAGALKLNEDTFMNGENSNYGAMFANKITVDCP